MQSLLLFIACFGVFTSLVLAKTDNQDVSALNDAYKSMNSPSKLNGWSSSRGDPCGDSWDDITCKGSSVTEMFVTSGGDGHSGGMVDPALCGLYAPESVSAFADIVSICVMSEPGLRPPVSNVVEALKRLV